MPTEPEEPDQPTYVVVFANQLRPSDQIIASITPNTSEGKGTILLFENDMVIAEVRNSNGCILVNTQFSNQGYWFDQYTEILIQPYRGDEE